MVRGILQVQGHTVDYYSVTSASVGLTLGVASHREIILFMTQGALDKFTKSEGWSAGGDTAIAVVSQGAGAKCRISSDWTHLISSEWDHPISG